MIESVSSSPWIFSNNEENSHPMYLLQKQNKYSTSQFLNALTFSLFSVDLKKASTRTNKPRGQHSKPKQLEVETLKPETLIYCIKCRFMIVCVNMWSSDLFMLKSRKFPKGSPALTTFGLLSKQINDFIYDTKFLPYSASFLCGWSEIHWGWCGLHLS